MKLFNKLNYNRFNVLYLIDRKYIYELNIIHWGTYDNHE